MGNNNRQEVKATLSGIVGAFKDTTIDDDSLDAMLAALTGLEPISKPVPTVKVATEGPSYSSARLAKELGLTPKALRRIIRKHFPFVENRAVPGLRETGRYDFSAEKAEEIKAWFKKQA